MSPCSSADGPRFRTGILGSALSMPNCWTVPAPVQTHFVADKAIAGGDAERRYSILQLIGVGKVKGKAWIRKACSGLTRSIVAPLTICQCLDFACHDVTHGSLRQSRPGSRLSGGTTTSYLRRSLMTEQRTELRRFHCRLAFASRRARSSWCRSVCDLRRLVKSSSESGVVLHRFLECPLHGKHPFVDRRGIVPIERDCCEKENEKQRVEIPPISRTWIKP